MAVQLECRIAKLEAASPQGHERMTAVVRWLHSPDGTAPIKYLTRHLVTENRTGWTEIHMQKV